MVYPAMCRKQTVYLRSSAHHGEAKVYAVNIAQYTCIGSPPKYGLKSRSHLHDCDCQKRYEVRVPITRLELAPPYLT
jgi:hypothetical protein